MTALSRPLAPALVPALVLALATLSGCATEGTLTDPDRQLAARLDRWCAIEDDDGHAEHADDHPGETLDRGHLRREIEGLAMHFPGHVPTLFACALVALDAGEPERAQSYLDHLFKLAPVHADAALLRARLAERDGNLPLARRLLEQQLGAAPDHSGLHEALAGVLWQAGEVERARGHLARAEALGAPPWRMAYNRGLLAESLGQREAAMAEFRRALELDPLLSPARQRLRALEAGAADEPSFGSGPALEDVPREPRRVPDGLRLRPIPPPPDDLPPEQDPPQVGEGGQVLPPEGGDWGPR